MRAAKQAGIKPTDIQAHTSPAAGPAKTPDQLRESILRKLMDMRKTWRNCAEPACRRKRGCASPRMICAERVPERDIPPEHQAASVAMLKRMLREKLAAHEAAGEM